MNVPQKPAPASKPILQPIIDRWSPLAFSDRTVEPEKIATFFEAARWAPSNYNEQPWRYLYALKEDGEIRETLEGLLVPGNAWAKHAGVLAISFGKKTFVKNEKENQWNLHDVGAASSYLVLQLPALGLVGHQMSGYDKANANAVLGVPEEFEPGSMLAIGYPGDHASLSEELQKREDSPRTRNSVEQFAFRGTWKS
ncbi:MAG: nitroreductase family protein [Patescibacteria group bacterium]